MNGREKGFALLTSHLGDPSRKPLTVAQFRELARRVVQDTPSRTVGELACEDIVRLGYDRVMANHILHLLSQEEQLLWYCQSGKKHDCQIITRVSEDYPRLLRHRLGLDAPGCLWAKGDLQLLKKPAVALVGSRELNPLNEAFAAEVGRQAALQGYVLVSGNAKGADRVAQDSCLEHGGQVVSVIADELKEHPREENVLYLSEDDFTQAFSSQRALSRNRVIHSLGWITFVAQCTMGKGGTWDGSRKNLKNRWSPVFVLDDGSQAMQALVDMGAEPVLGSQLEDFSGLNSMYNSFMV